MRPDTKAKYPQDWDCISASVILGRGGKCENCLTVKTPGNPLTVHHIDYDPGNNEAKNLIVLCAACHLRRQNKERKYGYKFLDQPDLFNKVKKGVNDDNR